MLEVKFADALTHAFDERTAARLGRTARHRRGSAASSALTPPAQRRIAPGVGASRRRVLHLEESPYADAPRLAGDEAKRARDQIVLVGEHRRIGTLSVR